jgi:hypothetical protein
MDISIKEACHENWNDMSPNEQGAFCSKCVKTVIDFTDKSLDEIKSFFAGHRQESTCGRFKNEQLSDLSFDAFFERFRKFEFTKRFALILFFTFGTYLFGTSTALAQSDSLALRRDTALKLPEITTYTAITNPPIDVRIVTTMGAVSIITSPQKLDWSRITLASPVWFSEPVKKPGQKPAPLKREAVYRRRD